MEATEYGTFEFHRGYGAGWDLRAEMLGYSDDIGFEAIGCRRMRILLIHFVND
jgi:hypothetical protein